MHIGLWLQICLVLINFSVKNSAFILDYFSHLDQEILMIKNILKIILFILLFNFVIGVNSQELPNPISLTIPRVSIGDQRYATKSNGNNSWIYEGSLSETDYIRYGWAKKRIDLNCKTKPASNCGYIKIYLNDDSSETNLITEYGSSPIPIEALSSKLIAGLNRIMIVYVEPEATSQTSKAVLSFNYKTAQDRPQISVLEPSNGALFLGDKKINGGVEFKVEINNFSLGSDESNSKTGQLKVYLNEIKGKPLFTARNSRPLGNGKELVEFTSANFDPEITIPDSKNSTLYFVLAKSNGENLDTIASRDVITNYGQTLTDIGIPEISIEEPKNDRADLNIDGDRKFLLNVKNFEILDKLTEGGNEPGKGYLQIFINDRVIQTDWGKTDFTLDEIQYTGNVDGRQTLRVQLVNKDFTRLTPEASATVNFIYKKDIQNNLLEEGEVNVDNTNWRFVFIGIIVLTVLVGITVLVFKG